MHWTMTLLMAGRTLTPFPALSSRNVLMLLDWQAADLVQVGRGCRNRACMHA